MYFEKGAAKKKFEFFLTFFQYYVYGVKDPLPMDIEFLVQDAYMLTRPQWKLLTDPIEASNSFVEIVRQNYQTASVDKPEETDDVDEVSASDDEDGPDDDAVDIADEDGDKEEEKTSEDEDDDEPQERISEDEEEQIVVTRQEDERDPEADADFDRELAKLMSESLDSRKFERKAVFDVPLPMRRAREQAANVEDSVVETAPAPAAPSNTMKFSLLSKRGNRQQTRSIDLPSDSNFAIAMKSKQQAEREEQQRIKSLVLNYDLRDENDNDGLEKQHNPYIQPRIDKAGNNRSNQRARKLQLSDVEWT